MLSSEIVDWLKNTIPGIVVLGAIGSIVAVFALWLLKKFVGLVWRGVKWLLPSLALVVASFLGRCWDRVLFRAATRIVHAKKLGTESVVALIIYHAVMTLVAFAQAAIVAAFIGFSYLKNGEVVFTTRLLCLSTFGVLSLVVALWHIAPIWFEVSVVALRAKGDSKRFEEIITKVNSKIRKAPVSAELVPKVEASQKTPAAQPAKGDTPRT